MNLVVFFRQGLLRVSARLFFTLSDEPANKTLDGRQDLLQVLSSIPTLPQQQQQQQQQQQHHHTHFVNDDVFDRVS
jgi:hypothetical protein